MSVFLKESLPALHLQILLYSFICFLLSLPSPLSAHFCLPFFLSFFQQTLAFTTSFCYSFNNQITQTCSWPLHLFFPLLGPLSLLLLTAWIILSQHSPKSSFSQQLTLTTILNCIFPLQLLYFPCYTYYLTYTYIIFVVYYLHLLYN